MRRANETGEKNTADRVFILLQRSSTFVLSI